MAEDTELDLEGELGFEIGGEQERREFEPIVPAWYRAKIEGLPKVSVINKPNNKYHGKNEIVFQFRLEGGKYNRRVLRSQIPLVKEFNWALDRVLVAAIGKGDPIKTKDQLRQALQDCSEKVVEIEVLKTPDKNDSSKYHNNVKGVRAAKVVESAGF